MKAPPSLQRGDQVCPGLDLCFDRVVLVGRDPDTLPGEGDVVVTRWVVALELSVVGLAAEVTDGLPAHRGREACIRKGLGGVRLERGDRGGLERDGPAVADDRRDLNALAVGIRDALEGVVVDDLRDEGVQRRYVGDRDGKVPDR